MGPRLRDWLLLLVSSAFTVAGVWMFTRGDKEGLAIAAFFGLGTLVPVSSIVTKRRFVRNTRIGGDVEAAPGRIPEDRHVLYATGGLMAVAGALMVATGGGMGPLFVACSVLICGAGVVLFAGTAIGWLGDRWLAFEPEGLRIGSRRATYLVHWDNVAAIRLGELSNNAAVCLHLRDPSRAAATAGPAADRVMKRFARNMRYTGFPILLLARHFALDAGLLARSLEGYVRDPARREALGRRAIEGPSR